MSLNPDLPVVHGTGGSPKYDDRVRRSIYASLKIGCTRTAAYQSAGISEMTFYRWLKDDVSFREEVVKCEGIAERAFTMPLRVAARQGDIGASKFWLERRRPANWREKITVDATGMSVEEELDEALNSDELDRRLQALAEDAVRRGATRSGGHPEAPEGEAGSPPEPS
jgi:hypothetical protein